MKRIINYSVFLFFTLFSCSTEKNEAAKILDSSEQGNRSDSFNKEESFSLVKILDSLEQVVSLDTLKEDKGISSSTYRKEPYTHKDFPTVVKLDSLLNALDTVNALAFLRKNNFDINAPFPWNYGTLLYHFTSDLPAEGFPKQVTKPELVKFLLNNGADPNASAGFFYSYDSWTEIEHKMIVSCDSVISLILIKAGSKYQPDFDLARAAKKQYKAGIIRALKNGADPSEALPFAYKHDKKFFEELLLRPMVNKDKALSLVCGQHLGHSTSIRGTCDEGYSYMSSPDTTFVRRLVKSGANPDIAIHYCASNKLEALTRFLIANGGNKNIALSYALQANDPDVDFIGKLISEGARIEKGHELHIIPRAVPANSQLRKLILTVIDGSGYSEIWQYEEVTFNSSSPLLDACKDNEIYDVEFMLQAGANPNIYTVPSASHEEIRNCNMISALGIAMRNNNGELVALLRKYKAKLPRGCKPPSDWVEEE